MKKAHLVSLLLCFCLGLALLPGSALAVQLKQSPYAFAGGLGTKDDPYLISTPDQLNAVRQGLDKHYKLVNDIDLSAWGDWLPIGAAEAQSRYGDPAPFTGSLDGAGHVISGLIITGATGDYRSGAVADNQNPTCFGLFGCVKGQEEKIAPGDAYEDTDLNGIRNLGIVGCNIDLDTAWDLGICHVGALAGEAVNTRIAGCWSTGGSVKATTGCDVGGIVGLAENSALRECWNSSAVSTANQAGGIAGDARSAWFSHCFNTGAVTGDQASGISQSVPSSGNQSTIRYCYNSGAISGSELAVGVGLAGTMDNVYNAGTLTGTNTSPIYGFSGLGTGGVRASHAGERFLTDENWTTSPTLNRKVLTALREDELLAAAGSAPAPATGVGGFTDVLATDYFADSVVWAVGRKITNGTTNTTFSPANTCTKAEALTFLYRAEGKPSHVPPSDQAVREAFSAANEDWFFAYYYESSCWAYNKGMIVPATALSAPCTRGDFVTYLWKAAGSPKAKAAGQFGDVAASAPYAQAVAWAVTQGITTGTSDSTFSPNDTCTRGQIVTFLYRAYKNT